MRQITIAVKIQFDADQITNGTPRKQSQQAIDLINDVLQREPYGLGAQIMERIGVPVVEKVQGL